MCLVCKAKTVISPRELFESIRRNVHFVSVATHLRLSIYESVNYVHLNTCLSPLCTCF